MNLAVTNVISSYHGFDRDFWLSYKTLEKVMEKQKWDEIKMNLLRNKRIDPKYIAPYQEQYDVELALLDAEWKAKSEEDKAAGTSVHETIHGMFCNNDQCLQSDFQIPMDTYTVMQTDKFLQTEKGLFPEFRLEIPLDEDYTLVGVADLIIKDGNHIRIIDWKTTDKIEFKSHYDFGQKKNKMMKYPLSKLMDVNGIHYQLQLSIYAWMLQKMNPDFIIDSLEIVQIKDLKPKRTFTVEYLKDDLDKFFKWHVKHIRMKEEIKKCNQTWL